MTGFDYVSCTDCSTEQRVCPECGTRHVSVDAYAESADLSLNYDKFALRENDGDVLRFKLTCWQCDWEEVRELELSVWHPLEAPDDNPGAEDR